MLFRTAAVAAVALLAATASVNAKCDPIMTNDGRYLCPDGAGVSAAPAGRAPRGTAGSRGDVIRYLPNPPGCPRVRVSCACRLAARWNLRQKFGPRLDKVTEWFAVFRRTRTPGPGVAAIQLRKRGPDHVMGIVGGGPGAWEVEDYNSGGHKNRLRRVSSLRGYILVDTRSRTASIRR